MVRKVTKTTWIVIVIICCFCFQTSAYSLLNSSLTITGNAIARIHNNVRITDFKIHEVSEGVISSYEEFSKTTTNSNVTLPNSDSYIIYKLEVANFESVEMQLSNIVGLSSNLTYELIDYTLHDMICDSNYKCTNGAKITFYLKIKYASYDSANTNYNVNLNYRFSEFSNVVMLGSTFKTTIPSTATHLVFTDEKPAQGTVLTDVSANSDMGVVGYLDGTTYKVSTRRTGVMPEANVDSSYMFSESSLQNIDLDNLDISATTNIIGMFQDCTSLTNINFGSDWDTSNITDMKYLFKNCSSLPTIDLSGFNTSKVISFSEFFNGCSSLTSVDVSKLNTSNSTSLKSMFKGCKMLNIIDVSNFITSKVTSFADMFYDCTSVLVLDVSGFNTSVATNLSGMFYNANKVKILDVSNWNTSKVTILSSIFYDCKSLLSVDTSNWETKKNTSLYGVFANCTSLTELDLSNWDVSSVTTAYWMLQGCTSLVTLDVSGWKFKNNVTINGMFFGLTHLKSIDLSDWDTSMVTGMNNVFTNCFVIESLDLSSWDTSLVTNMGVMFAYCNNLKEIYVGDGWDTSAVSESSSMFINCLSLPNYSSEYQDATKAYVGDGGYLSYKPLSMTIDGIEYQFEDGMTWEEWINSEYNIDEFYIIGSGQILSKSDYMLGLNSFAVYSYQVIEPNASYYTSSEPLEEEQI